MGVPLACRCGGFCKKQNFFDENEFLNDEYNASKNNNEIVSSNIRTTGVVSLFKTPTLNSGNTKLKNNNNTFLKVLDDTLTSDKNKINEEDESKIEENKSKLIPESTYANERKYVKKLDVNEDWKKFYTEEEYLKLTKTIPKFINNIDKDGNALLFSKGLFGNYDKIPSFYKGFVNTHFIYNGGGELYLQNGEKYEGVFYCGKLNGWGRYIDKNGFCYEGMFVDGGLTGKGYEIYQDENGNNSYYEGDFVNCIKEGKGNESTDIFVYDGDFSNDIKHGNGILTYKKCSDRYEGKFINGVINGHGHYIWDNKHEYEGEFVNAKMHGSGVYKWPDGSIYKGEYVNNIKEGKGEFIWPDKRVYVGTFHEGKPHGKGILKIKGVTIENAEFNKGQFVGNLKEIISKKKAEIEEENKTKDENDKTNN